MLASGELLPNAKLAQVKLLPNVFRKPSKINILIDQQLIGISIDQEIRHHLTRKQE